uniref:CCHC-type domain-containing protein n=1 Tax=Lepisosteus oculatus TaxID=7918 RepID=W5NN66_LEPOC
AAICRQVWEKVVEKKEEAPLNAFRIEPLFARELRPLYVHMHNPFIPEEDIVTFLRRYVDVQGSGTKERDEKGYWTGRRRFLVRLRPGAAPEGGVVHPPPAFSIGANGGTVRYPGQPKVCHRCGKEGHVVATCPSKVCRKCGAEGHLAADCRAVVRCNLCGMQGHLYNVCPDRKRTYAEAAATAASKKKESQSARRQD